MLRQAQHSSVRDLAYRLLKERPEALERDVIRLFNRNYLPGDHLIIETALSVVQDRESIHSLGLDVIDLAESQLHPELTTSLEWVYEGTPCSNCREYALSALLARDRATDARLQECLWDCSTDTQTLAKDSLASQS